MSFGVRDEIGETMWTAVYQDVRRVCGRRSIEKNENAKRDCRVVAAFVSIIMMVVRERKAVGKERKNKKKERGRGM
jgi:hypothetical protein